MKNKTKKTPQTEAECEALDCSQCIYNKILYDHLSTGKRVWSGYECTQHGPRLNETKSKTFKKLKVIAIIAAGWYFLTFGAWSFGHGLIKVIDSTVTNLLPWPMEWLLGLSTGILVYYTFMLIKLISEVLYKRLMEEMK